MTNIKYHIVGTIDTPNTYIQYVAKRIGACIKNPYIINQNHIFSKYYCEVISG